MIIIRHNRLPTADKTQEKPTVRPEPTKPRLQIPNGSIGNILRDICKRYDVLPDQVMNKSRNKVVVAARQEFICTLHFKHGYASARIATIMSMDLTSVKHFLGLRKSSQEKFADLQKQYA